MTADGRGVRVVPDPQVVTSHEDLAMHLKAHTASGSVVIDVETTGPDDASRVSPLRNEVLWVGLASPGMASVIPMGHPNGDLLRLERPLLKHGALRRAKGLPPLESDYSRDDSKAVPVFSEPPRQLTRTEVMEALRPLLFDPEREIVGHNVKFDANSLRKYYGGELPTSVLRDTMVTAAVVDSTSQGRLGLDDCVKRTLGKTLEKGVGKNVLLHTFSDVAAYLWRDVRYTLLLWNALSRRVRRDGLERIVDLESDVLRVVCEMEAHGVRIDSEVLGSLAVHLEDGITRARADAFRAAGSVFNVNSNADKIRILYEERGLTPAKKTPKGSPSVDAEALEAHRGDGVADALLELADLQKMKSTYVVPYLGGEVVRTTSGKSRVEQRSSALLSGRVHGRFNQVGAETGRMSSSSPNLQNIPSPERGEFGRIIRSAFLPDPGHVIVQADYSQIEPRIIASFSGDPTMLAAYAAGQDIYTALAEPLGLDRKAGKTLMLAMSYGVGPDKVASNLGVGVNRAKEILQEFEQTFPRIVKLKAAVVSKARSRKPMPYVTTVTGRRRYLPEFFRDENRGARQAFNTLIQGSAADVMKVALVRCHGALPEGAHLLLTVHDEVVVSSPEELVKEVSDVVRESMEGVRFDAITVPLLADVKVAANWGETKG